jgi:uncharacterized protein
VTGPTARAWRAGNGCVIVRVRVTPKSAKDGVEGIEPGADGPAIRVRVRAAPSEGDANAAVVRAAAGWLDVPKSSMAVSAGYKSRLKSLTITGDADELGTRLAQRLAATHYDKTL